MRNKQTDKKNVHSMLNDSIKIIDGVKYYPEDFFENNGAEGGKKGNDVPKEVKTARAEKGWATRRKLLTPLSNRRLRNKTPSDIIKEQES